MNTTTERKLNVVMPAYGELENLRELLPKLHAIVAAVPGLETSVKVILPSSAPESEHEELTALGAHPVRRTPSDSFGDAIRSGIAAVDADADYVIVMDADGSHDPATIPRLLEKAEGAHVVVASRYTAGGVTDNSLLLRLMSRSLNTAYRLILGITCHDVSTNYKLYKREDLEQVELESKDFDIVEELLFRIKVIHGRSLVITEIPDHFFERKHGTTKRRLGPFVVSYLRTLLKLSRSAARR